MSSRSAGRPVGNWHDFPISGDGFEQRYAGRVEDGRDHFSDPALAG